MKIVFVVDKKNSALYTNAYSRKLSTQDKVIVANEYSSPIKLLDKLLCESADIVFFTWRQAVFDSLLADNSLKKLALLRAQSLLGVLIPDHLGLMQERIQFEKKILDVCDYYFVTNMLLKEKYEENFGDFPPLAILHDLPNTELINSIKNTFPRIANNPPKIIWVGNSKWGARQNIKDHKGYFRCIEPLKHVILNHRCCFDFEVIDSSKEFVPQEKVLEKIRKSDILIQASRSEGTGIPLLEALGLGTPILTTPVGISMELLNMNPLHFIIDSDANKIHEQLHQIFDTNLIGTDVHLMYIFDRYISAARSENVIFNRIGKRNINIVRYNNLRLQIKTKLIWIYRYLMQILNEIQ